MLDNNLLAIEIMSAQGLLNVFSCSSPTSKNISKRKLRQTRSLDPALIRNYGAESSTSSGYPGEAKLNCFASSQTGGLSYLQKSSENLAAGQVETRARTTRVKQHHSSSSLFPSLDTSLSVDCNLDHEGKNLKWTSTELSIRSTTPTSAGSTTTLFSPRKWLQKKQHHQETPSYMVYQSEVGVGS